MSKTLAPNASAVPGLGLFNFFFTNRNSDATRAILQNVTPEQRKLLLQSVFGAEYEAMVAVFREANLQFASMIFDFIDEEEKIEILRRIEFAYILPEHDLSREDDIAFDKIFDITNPQSRLKQLKDREGETLLTASQEHSNRKLWRKLINNQVDLYGTDANGDHAFVTLLNKQNFDFFKDAAPRLMDDLRQNKPEAQALYAKIMLDLPKDHAMPYYHSADTTFEEYKEALEANHILHLMYSQDEAPAFYSQNVAILRKIVEKFDDRSPNFNYKKEFLHVLKMMQHLDEKIKISDRVEIEIIRVPDSTHESFFIIEYVDGIAKTFSLCDGNMPYDERVGFKGVGFGEACFAIRPELARNDGLSQAIHEYIRQKKEREDLNGREEFRLDEMLANFVVCRGNPAKPIVTQQCITTKKQSRGNCSIKSLHILIRAILRKIYLAQNLQRENQENLPENLPTSAKKARLAREEFPLEASERETYKEYRAEVINNCIKVIFNLATKPSSFERNTPNYTLVVDAASNLLLHAAAKDDTRLMAYALQTLRERGFSIEQISDIKNEQGQNLLFIAATYSSLQALIFCLENGISPRNTNNGQNIFDRMTPNIPEARINLAVFIRTLNESRIELPPALLEELFISAEKNNCWMAMEFLLNKNFDSTRILHACINSANEDFNFMEKELLERRRNGEVIDMNQFRTVVLDLENVHTNKIHHILRFNPDCTRIHNDIDAFTLARGASNHHFQERVAEILRDHTDSPSAAVNLRVRSVSNASQSEKHYR